MDMHPKVAALLAQQDIARAAALIEHAQARTAVAQSKVRYLAACDALVALKASQTAERAALIGYLNANA